MISWCVLASLIFAASLAAPEEECVINSNEDIHHEISEEQTINDNFLNVSTSNAETINLNCDEKIIEYNLDTATGILSLSLKESVLHRPDEDKPKLDIECSFFCNNNAKHAVRLYLKIRNVNNNTPKFIDSPYEYNISEYAKIGTTVNPDPIVMYDRDFPETDPVMELEAEVNKPGMFMFLSYPPEAYSKYLHLYIILDGKLDYSKETMYNINITVKDKGVPPNTNETTVTINVIDEDDQDPIFEEFLYYTEIIINKTKDQMYLRSKDDGQNILYEDLNEENGVNLLLKIEPKEILAYDQDFGINASINYALGKTDYAEYFEVNKEEGSIFFKKFEERMVSNHSFTVPLEAYQTDNDRRRCKAALVVNITVVNPVQPHFVLPIYIPKNLLVNDNFYQVGAVQDDLMYQIYDAENQYIFINDTSGSLSLLQNASHLPATFDFDIVAETPVATISNKFQGHFEVIERDPLKMPLFNKSVYFIEIFKRSKKSDHLFKIPVNDPKAELHLVGNDSRYFHIEESVNWIILVEELLPDRTMYFITIEAITKNVNLMMERDKAEVIFQVTDSDCSPRIFEEDIYLVNMLPDWEINSIVFSIKSNLPDVVFSLSGEHADHFSIKSDGNIYLMKPMNICQGSVLLVFGKLKVPPFVNGSAKIIFQVSDPYCTTRLFPIDAHFIDMSPDWKEGTSIINLISLLPNVTFFLENDNTNFTIDHTSGEIVMSGPVNICESQNLTVSGKPEKFFYQGGMTKIIFQVSDPYCTTRLFPTDAHFIDMSPDWKEGTSIINLTSLLPNVTFVLDDNTNFTIDHTSGEIVMSVPINICKNRSLTVSGMPEKFFYQEGMTKIILQVSDPYCTTRLFPTDVYIVDMSPDWKEGTNIINLTSLLPDVSFALEDNTGFSIDNASGGIIVSGPIDKCKRHRLTVFGKPARFFYQEGRAQVILQVTDERCYAKLFENNSYVIDISSGWEEGDNILNLTVSTPVNEFHLLGKDAAYFKITSGGNLYLVEKLNICKNYRFLVFGQADEPVLRNGTTQIILLSKEAKCYKPIFEKESFLIDISSEWKTGENVYNLSSEFPDVIFSLKDNNEYFEINNATGQLFLVKQLDKCKKYEVSIHGNTTGPPPQEGVTKLIFLSEVCVKKTREFSKCVYTVNIKSKETKGKTLLKFREDNETSNVKFVITKGNEDGLFDIKDGELLLNQQSAIDGQYYLKVVQMIEEKVSRSVTRNDHLDVSNNEALVIVNIGERKSQIRFLHPGNWFKLFLPTAPLSDYWFTVKTVVGGEMNSLEFSVGPEDNTDFDVDSTSGLVFPKVDVTTADGYKRDIVVSATAASESAELSIHIRRLRYNNVIGITLESNSTDVINLKNIERSMSATLQCDVHVLQYKRRTDSDGYELVAGAMIDNQLLTVQELEERIKSKTENLKDIIGDFGLAPYMEKLTKDPAEKSKVDPLLISTILLACLSIILCGLVLFFVTIRKFRSETADFTMSEGKESLSEREVIPFSNFNHVGVTINSESIQPEYSTVTPLQKIEPEDIDKTENIIINSLSNEATVECDRKSNPYANEDEADVNCSTRINIQPELNRCVEETTNEDRNLLDNKETESHSYYNEAFDNNPLNPVEENKIANTSPNENPTDEQNELETMPDCNATSEIGEKKTSVKFNDVATLIP